MRDSFVFYRSFYEAIECLEDIDRLELYDAICEYALNQNITETKPMVNALFKLIKPQIEANNKRYENGKRGGRKPKQNQNETKTKPNENQTETKSKPNVNVNVNVNDNVNVNKRFVAPTLEEVSSYCLERNNNVDPNAFIDFYESKGWKVGSSPMKDWKACVRTWEQRHRPVSKEAKPIYDDSNNPKVDFSILDQLKEEQWT